MFIAKVGSYQELDTKVVTDADKVVVDWWEYVSIRGEGTQHSDGKRTL